MKQRLIIFVILGVLILAVDTIFNNESDKMAYHEKSGGIGLYKSDSHFTEIRLVSWSIKPSEWLTLVIKIVFFKILRNIQHFEYRLKALHSFCPADLCSESCTSSVLFADFKRL